MKKILLVCCLLGGLGRASAQPNLSASQMHDRVTSYLKKTLINPDSYQPVDWGEPKPETQQAEDIDKASDEMQAFVDGVKKGKASDKHVEEMEAAGTPVATLIKLNHKSMAIMAEADKHKKRADALMASTNQSVLGTGIMHTYRSKNKAGAIITTRAFFVALNSGSIKVLKQELP